VDDEVTIDNHESYSDPSESSLEKIYSLGNKINEYVETLAEDKENAYAAEIWAALIPAIISAIPAVVQGISGLVNGSRQQAAPPRPAPAPQQQNRPAPGPTPPRPAPAPQQQNRPAPGPTPPRPAPAPQQQNRPAPRPTPPRPAPAPIPQPIAQQTLQPTQTPAAQGGGVDANIVNQFINVLSDPAVLQMLQTAVVSGRQETIEVGPEKVPVTTGAVLNAISDYAKRISFGLADGIYETPEYLLDNYGNFKCDPASPRERAEVLMELFNIKS
jgi:outer membrane biosynthesis protein TonB